ncbi:MAG: glycoside hydrolase family 5 protein [Fimbriimonas sp.]
MNGVLTTIVYLFAAPVADDGIATMRNMGTGFNLGNTFDIKANPTDLRDVRKVIDLYANAGLTHVRMPVTWMDGFDGDHLADTSGTINTKHARLRELKLAVDYALGKGLYVVINTHHENWLKKNYNGAAHDAAFANLWKGIATEFKTRNHHLVFEILNEPDGVFGDWGGPVKPYDAIALERTRKINQVGYDAIRATGGSNTSRIIMFGTNGQGNHTMLAPLYPSAETLPGKGKDPYIAATVHSYDPWGFCGQDGVNSACPGDATVKESIEKVLAHAAKLKIGINYGEFGVGRAANQNDRNTPAVKGYYRTVTRTVRAAGMSVTPWDDRGLFGLIEAEQGGYRFKFGIVPEMLK